MSAGKPSPDRIFDIGCGYRASKVLLSAIELDLFTILSDQPLDAVALAQRTGLHPRGAGDFFDTLVALGLLTRDDEGRYSNTTETGFYLDRRKPTHIGSMFEQYNASEYGLWSSLTQALRTGLPQTGITAAQHFAGLYADPVRFRRFVKSMTGGSLSPPRQLPRNFLGKTTRPLSTSELLKDACRLKWRSLTRTFAAAASICPSSGKCSRLMCANVA